MLAHAAARKIVSDAFDAADDWIAEEATKGSVVITADILLADRCLKQGATVIAPTGKPFTEASIGGAIATRAIMADLRAGGDAIGSLPFESALAALAADATARIGARRITARWNCWPAGVIGDAPSCSAREWWWW